MRAWTAGFIANRTELLPATGLPPTASDRDLLCALFLRHGTDSARKIEGPFVWILHDDAGGRLVASRDRAGAFAIYYRETAGRVAIGVRIRQLRTGSASLPLNFRTLVAQIHGRAPLPTETCYAGVQALEPGTTLTVSAAGLSIERYWQLEARQTLRLASDAEYAEAVRELLLAVVERYRPDEPTAVALSSGLDSTAVAAALRQTTGSAPIALITWGTPDLPASDETAGAAAVAAHLGLPLDVLRGDELWPLSDDEGIRTLEEGPTINFRELWEGMFGRLRRQGIRVLLSGASGDHLFGGSGVLVYPDLLLSGRWRRLAGRLRSHRERSGELLTAIVYRDLLKPLARAYLPRRWTVARHRIPWLGQQFRQLVDEVLPPDSGRWRRLPGRRLRLRALTDDMLAHNLALVATLAAEHGIELRHPLTDHRLMEFATSLPLDQCLRAGLAKFVLRNSMQGLLPPSILEAPDKILPLALFERGLRHREKAKVQSLLRGMRSAELGLVDEQELRRAYRRYLETGRGTLFWHTLTLEDWLRRYA